MNFRIWTKWFWVRVQLQSPKLQISRLLWARSSLRFRQLWSIDSLWKAYMTWQKHTVTCTVQISTQNTAKWLSARLRAKWHVVRVQLQSLPMYVILCFIFNLCECYWFPEKKHFLTKKERKTVCWKCRSKKFISDALLQ